jgi:uncharacterized membrane protein YqjE
MISTDQQTPTFGSLTQRLINTCIGAVGNRAELFAIEFEEENHRLLGLLLFGAGGLFLAMMTVLLLTGTIIFLVPPEHRVYAALGFAVLYLAGTVVAGMMIRHMLKRKPFAESLKQFKKDAELLDAFK